MLEVTEQTFDQEVMASEVPVLVDFSAPWCGPCRMIGPMLDVMAEKYKGKVKFVTVDIDVSRPLASRYQVTSVPTMVLIKDKQEISRWVGAASLPRITAELKGPEGGFDA